MNTVNISPLAYSAAEGLGKQQIECGEGRTGTQGLPGLKHLRGITLNPSATACAWVGGAGVLYRGAVGAKEFFFLNKVPERSRVSGWERSVIGWSVASVSARSWKENFLRPAVLKCQAW